MWKSKGHRTMVYVLKPGSLGNTGLREEWICGGHQEGHRDGSALGGSCRDF